MVVKSSEPLRAGSCRGSCVREAARTLAGEALSPPERRCAPADTERPCAVRYSHSGSADFLDSIVPPYRTVNEAPPAAAQRTSRSRHRTRSLRDAPGLAVAVPAPGSWSLRAHRGWSCSCCQSARTDRGVRITAGEGASQSGERAGRCRQLDLATQRRGDPLCSLETTRHSLPRRGPSYGSRAGAAGSSSLSATTRAPAASSCRAISNATCAPNESPASTSGPLTPPNGASTSSADITHTHE